VLSNDGQQVLGDPSQGPYEGRDDALIGILNDTSGPLYDIHLAAPGLFDFDGDGICDAPAWPVAIDPVPPTCPSNAGPPGYLANGYEGPASYFGNVAAGGASGDVEFTVGQGLQPGQSTYFSLAEPPSRRSISVGYPVSLTTSLSTSTAHGNGILTAPSQPVIDAATLQGMQLTSAGGTIAYNVYSDPGCTHLVASSAPEPVVGGVPPTSGPLSLPAGEYYWQAVYSGDPQDQPAVSQCGAEVQASCQPSSSAIVQYDDLGGSKQGFLNQHSIHLGSIDDRLEVVGAGYVPGTTVTFDVGGRPISGPNPVVGADGMFSTQFDVPARSLSPLPFRTGAVETVLSRDAAGCSSSAQAMLGSTGKGEAQRRSEVISKATIADALAVAALSGAVRHATQPASFALEIGGGVAIAWQSWQAANYSEIAADPPDHSFHTVIIPPELPVQLAAPAGVSGSERRLVFALVAGETGDGELLYALRVTLDRAATAVSERAPACAVRQHLAALNYAQQADAIETADQRLLERLAGLLQKLSHAKLVRSFSDSQLTAGATQIVRHGTARGLINSWSALYGAPMARELSLSLRYAARLALVSAVWPAPATGAVPSVLKQDMTPGSTAFAPTRAGLGPHFLEDLVATATAGAGVRANPSACH
jgi:hypothetical protein